MDPITTAIIAALVSGINAVGSQAVTDAYSALKRVILKKLPKSSDAKEAFEALESSPESEAPQQRLNTSLVEERVSDNAEVISLLNTLIEKMSVSSSGQSALSKYNIKADKIGAAGENITIQSQSF